MMQFKRVKAVIQDKLVAPTLATKSFMPLVRFGARSIDNGTWECYNVYNSEADQAMKHTCSDLIACSDCVCCDNCEWCTHCYKDTFCRFCADCFDCGQCNGCILCVGSFFCENCYELDTCEYCKNCERCTNCERCIDCHDCINCVGLVGKYGWKDNKYGGGYRDQSENKRFFELSQVSDSMDCRTRPSKAPRTLVAGRQVGLARQTAPSPATLQR